MNEKENLQTHSHICRLMASTLEFELAMLRLIDSGSLGNDITAHSIKMEIDNIKSSIDTIIDRTIRLSIREDATK